MEFNDLISNIIILSKNKKNKNRDFNPLRHSRSSSITDRYKSLRKVSINFVFRETAMMRMEKRTLQMRLNRCRNIVEV